MYYDSNNKERDYRMSLHKYFDVCPEWVRFSIPPERNDPTESGSNECSCRNTQRHVHEFLGSTLLAESGAERHNHRFAGVTSEAIPTSSGSHRHKILARTDYHDHYHELKEILTGPAIKVSDNKHVHFVSGETTENDGHVHQFQFATLIESPLLPKSKR